MKITSFACTAYQTNSYLVIDENTNEGFIVDPGAYVPQMQEAIKESGVNIKYIIVTHGHDDHTGGIDKYKEVLPEVKVVAYKDEVAFIESQIASKVDIALSDEEEISLGSLTLRALFTPGHTPGAMSLFVPQVNVLFSGDTLFRQSIGRTDFPGGSLRDIDKSIKTKLYTLPEETQVFPGHMAPTTIGFEKENNPFVFL